MRTTINPRNCYSLEHKHAKLVQKVLWEDPGHIEVLQGNLQVAPTASSNSCTLIPLALTAAHCQLCMTSCTLVHKQGFRDAALQAFVLSKCKSTPNKRVGFVLCRTVTTSLWEAAALSGACVGRRNAGGHDVALLREVRLVPASSNRQLKPKRSGQVLRCRLDFLACKEFRRSVKTLLRGYHVTCSAVRHRVRENPLLGFRNLFNIGHA